MRFAQKRGRTYLYRTGSFKKDQWAESLIRQQRIEGGLVGILCTMETCNSFDLRPAEKRPRFVSMKRQQRVLYYYFLDPQLGLIHVRLQTWATYTLQVYVNGHAWLAQQLVRLGMGLHAGRIDGSLTSADRLNQATSRDRAVSGGSVGHVSQAEGREFEPRRPLAFPGLR